MEDCVCPVCQNKILEVAFRLGRVIQVNGTWFHLACTLNLSLHELTDLAKKDNDGK